MSNSIINKEDVNTNYIAENYYIFTIDGNKVSTKKEFFDAVEIYDELRDGSYHYSI